jgi:hypothetical protein
MFETRQARLRWHLVNRGWASALTLSMAAVLAPLLQNSFDLSIKPCDRERRAAHNLGRHTMAIALAGDPTPPVRFNGLQLTMHS